MSLSKEGWFWRFAVITFVGGKGEGVRTRMALIFGAFYRPRASGNDEPFSQQNTPDPLLTPYCCASQQSTSDVYFPQADDRICSKEVVEAVPTVHN